MVTGPALPPEVGEAVRRALIAATLAELFGGVATEVRSPVCPMCDEGPAGVFGYWQAACGNDSCPVFLWDPRDTPEDFRRKAQPMRVQERGPDGVWRDAE